MRKNEDAQTHIDELLKMVQSPHKSSLERSIELLAMLGIKTSETLELRLSSTKSCDLSDLAQRAVNAFLLALHIHPNVLAVHSTVASLFVADEKVFTPTLPQEAMKQFHAALFGADYTPTPVRIVPDNSLDTRTVAVRFSIDPESEEFHEAVVSIIKDLLFQDGA